jgi:hypothetical protein
MKTKPTGTGSAPAQVPANNDLIGKPKLYDPGIYTVFGIFLSLVPVLYMSWKNSPFLPEPDKHRAQVKKYSLLFLGLMVVYFLVCSWALAVATRGLVAAMTSDVGKGYYAYMSGDLSGLSSPEMDFAKTVIQNASTIYFFLNLALLILFLRYTGKAEGGFFREGYKNKTLLGRQAGIPFLVGVAFIAFLYIAQTPIMEAIAKIFLK